MCTGSGKGRKVNVAVDFKFLHTSHELLSSFANAWCLCVCVCAREDQRSCSSKPQTMHEREATGVRTGANYPSRGGHSFAGPPFGGIPVIQFCSVPNISVPGTTRFSYNIRFCTTYLAADCGCGCVRELRFRSGRSAHRNCPVRLCLCSRA